MLKSLFQQKSLKETLIEKNLITADDWDVVDAAVSEGDSEMLAASKELGSNLVFMQRLLNSLVL